jgi:hypothetical protein
MARSKENRTVGDAYFWIQDTEVLQTEFKKNGATVVYEPVIRELYDMKEFGISDLDGKMLAFGQDWPAEA